MPRCSRCGSSIRRASTACSASRRSEVVLVNARTRERPEKAQAIAQTSLAGGGDADKGRATSPLPPSALTEVGDAPEDAQRKIDAMQEQQTLLLAQLKRALAALPPPDPKQPYLQPGRGGARGQAPPDGAACWPKSSAASRKKTRGPRSAT
jgi:hypothetical protein